MKASVRAKVEHPFLKKKILLPQALQDMGKVLVLHQ